MGRKIAYIIPSFKSSPKEKAYLNIGRFFREANIEPIYVDVKWDNSTISQNTENFISLANSKQSEYTCVLGFSFGTLIAFIAASKIKMDLLILCSLSPYFSEDLPYLKKSWKENVGKNRVKDLEAINSKNAAQKISTKTYVLYGTKEGPQIEKRAKDVFKNLKGDKHLIFLEEVNHDISNGRYLDQLHQIIISNTIE
ncbi:hypothetical protein A2714_04835 [Candidatus Woesebacteria bacterium RIFCSPHIGHO2_01_FULL_38_9]|uniref:Alpha/beta hydrolase n=2 Tax=Candidatus Woeseibacteriota TaxID=1752722 RepID=A0A1F7XZ91_9BACT|nr:MAG: hypothetical protein A2714_04835 [Candidatus Woesebacteria bacterium RIFCSPHIGHO2_01_FULL_38_9]OGM58871.1 MAG: hypothetical protein A3A75_06435 [Candidatus Woesebacteria bacterium RIFCSPLOWO2_01_FULL_39_10]